MFCRPATFNDFLSRNNLIDEIYDAMNNDDLSEVAMTALRVLKKTKSLHPLNTVIKSEKISEDYRNLGNTSYKNNDNQLALVMYNQAILVAPKNSKQMKLAISNRSALLYKMKAYEACLKDIETCFAMGCPNDIINKLKKRKIDVIKLIASKDESLTYLNGCVDTYINCNMASHPLISCASRHVDIKGSITPKVIASTDIQVGMVVACEKAYVSYTDGMNSFTACHYCQRQSLNLIPCDNCRFVMFCDDDCKSECYNEYHKYECQIMEAIKMYVHSALANLMFKVVLKMKSKCKSWKELIDASYSTGLDRMKTSSIEDIYNSNNLFSVLNIRDDKPFVYGILYNASFVCAALLHYLEEIPFFYPKKYSEKQQAMRALGRIMLFLSLYQTSLPLLQMVTDVSNEQSYFNKFINHGIFSFTGKLKKSCKPNLIVLNKNNELVLLAIRTIKSGEELTISFQQHLLDNNFIKEQHNIRNFLFTGNVCDCSICSGCETMKGKGQLSTSQKNYYTNLNLSGIDERLNSMPLYDVFIKLLQAMNVFSNLPHSEEYGEIYKRFRKCTMIFEIVKGQNYIFDFLKEFRLQIEN